MSQKGAAESDKVMAEDIVELHFKRLCSRGQAFGTPFHDSRASQHINLLSELPSMLDDGVPLLLRKVIVGSKNCGVLLVAIPFVGIERTEVGHTWDGHGLGRLGH